MQEWLTAQLAQGLPAFSGAAVTGTIPVKEELLNDLIARFLAQSGSQAPPAPAPPVDVRTLIRFVRTATVHAEPGVVRLTFELRV